MLGQMTRGVPKDTAELRNFLATLAGENSRRSYVASRLLTGLEKHTLPDDIVDQLVNLDPLRVTSLLDRISRNNTVYDFPRQLVLSLAEKFSRGRALQL